ncbi:gluconate 2-dehydrogenase subunit 3 family protein [Bradyrhizobium australafricanum]|uniref:gluconate 2-dehydrogenase subunit 3 family protein n=1 Tax=Bradyrhizobium australafricanum TaxID=2821406 RepID=UPI001CE23A36|nr:gluconate 2-dehydrogenase subunit 3 family protein [Bradyrhizobium australafricanum]MCA6098193.1 gluconate 2-dehydrogenase subunit 3 family protein [Bradyrhizobium australafricanum]
MPATVLDPGDEYVLNHCTKHINRSGFDEASSATISEAWRFPIVGPMREDNPAPFDGNLVTFVYRLKPGDERPVRILGTFATLYEPIPLKRVLFQGDDTGYRAVSFVVPQSQVHTYKFYIDGKFILDPINPQRVQLANGRLWSRFFTDGYLQPLVLELWELRTLYRLIEQILPFRSAESENFLKRYYFGLNRDQRKNDMAKAYRLDTSVGEVNAIDKLLAREEAHRLTDYRLCLRQIDRALRKQNPFIDPYEMPAENYVQLYEAMAASKPGDNSIPGWDYGEYDNPAYFLYLLRRHAVTAAFSHPKYAGNVGAAGWGYLSERYVSQQTGATLFDWRPALEPPLGTSRYYR